MPSGVSAQVTERARSVLNWETIAFGYRFCPVRAVVGAVFGCALVTLFLVARVAVSPSVNGWRWMELCLAFYGVGLILRLPRWTATEGPWKNGLVREAARLGIYVVMAAMLIDKQRVDSQAVRELLGMTAICIGAAFGLACGRQPTRPK